MTRPDHAAEARAALEGAGDGRNVATDAPLVALTHATLALVEEQRLANRIAALALHVDSTRLHLTFTEESDLIFAIRRGVIS